MRCGGEKKSERVTNEKQKKKIKNEVSLTLRALVSKASGKKENE